MTSQSNLNQESINQSYNNDCKCIKELCGELTDDKINVIVSDLKIEYGDLEWLTYNHVKKRKRIKKYIRENLIDIFELSSEYLKNLEDQGIPLESQYNRFWQEPWT